jgi:hypothetical protein
MPRNGDRQLKLSGGVSTGLPLVASMENGDETYCPAFLAVRRNLLLRGRAELEWLGWIIRRH